MGVKQKRILKLALFALGVFFVVVGLDVRSLTKKIIEGKSFRKTDSLYILKVYPDSPAAEAGLEEGDEVLKINDEKVVDFYEQSEKNPIDQTTITIERDRKTIQVSFSKGSFGHAVGGRLGVTVSKYFFVATNRDIVIREHFSKMIWPPTNDGPTFGQKYFAYVLGITQIVIGVTMILISIFSHRRCWQNIEKSHLHGTCTAV